jgi:hypothetical protein
VHDRYQNYDAADRGTQDHQLCVAQYSDTAVMPISKRSMPVNRVADLTLSA